ncbi:MAG: DUF3047 domain-containing protein [Candidatus Margulisiibacteriota bacterium]
MKTILIALVLAFSIGNLYPVVALEKPIALSPLSEWQPVTFRRIPKPTQFLVQPDGSLLIRAEKSGASGLTHKTAFEVHQTPLFSWDWRVEQVFEHGELGKEKSNDAPLRVVVIFDYDPKAATLLERWMYGVYHKVYHRYPPFRSLNYVWGNGPETLGLMTDNQPLKTRVFILKTGPSKTWDSRTIDIEADYQKAFGRKAPRFARIGLMSNGDNTGETAISFVRHLRVHSR